MKLSFRERQELLQQYADDIKRMLQCLAAAGCQTTEDAAVQAWAEYSDDYCAGWLVLPEDDVTLLETLLKYLKDPESAEVWRVTGINAADGSGRILVPLPSDLVARAGWTSGDELMIEMIDTRTLVLRRV
ncbi:MAG: hypothetical protein ACREYA_07935 [Cupriavidus necator]